MSAETIQTIATLATLTIVAVGVTFAALQVRQETLARRLQAISAIWSEVWPDAASRALRVLQDLPDGFEDAAMTPEQADALRTLYRHYNRMGFLLQAGLVKERDILGYPPFGILAAENWAKFKPYLDRYPWGGTPGFSVHWEYLAIRAKAYWEHRGREWLASMPHYRGEAGALYKDLDEAMALRPSG